MLFDVDVINEQDVLVFGQKLMPCALRRAAAVDWRKERDGTRPGVRSVRYRLLAHRCAEKCDGMRGKKGNTQKHLVSVMAHLPTPLTLTPLRSGFGILSTAMDRTRQATLPTYHSASDLTTLR